MEAALPYLYDLIRIALMFSICLGLAGPLTWADRRQGAVVQDRVGPNRASIVLFGRELRLFGLLHPIADAIKLFTKEDVVNIRADRFLFNIAPIIAMSPALVTFAVIPFGPDLHFGDFVFPLQVARLDAGILYIFAVSSLAVFGVTLAGYAASSRLAMLGSLRASAQMISYEVTMGLSVIGLVLIWGTLEPSAMVLAQGELLGGWLPAWGIFLQPVAFIIFFTAAIAENKRVPFDLPEGESEIVGYFVEHSGMRFGMFMASEYIEMVVVSGMLTTFFFGGWQVPYLFDAGVHGLTEAGFFFPWGSSFEIGTVAATILRLLSFAFKLLFFIWFMLMLRWTLPRYRYDQVMVLGWQRLLPLSLVNLVITAAAVLAFAS